MSNITQEYLKSILNYNEVSGKFYWKADNTACPGVSFDKNSSKWKASISIRNKRKHIGLFIDWFDAVCARKSVENILIMENGNV